jgi:hypothetical protein
VWSLRLPERARRYGNDCHSSASASRSKTGASCLRNSRYAASSER